MCVLRAVDCNHAFPLPHCRPLAVKLSPLWLYSRFAYNWALAEWQRQYEAGEKPNEAALRRQFNAIKPVEFPWGEGRSHAVVHP